MLTVLFLFALLPRANAQSTSLINNPTISIQSPGNIASCDTVDIKWLAVSFASTNIPFTINYTNEGTGISGVATTVSDATKQIASWTVNVPTTGTYTLTGSADGAYVYQSDPFTITVSNTSCYNTLLATTSTATTSTATTSTTSTVTPTSAPRTTTSSPVSFGRSTNSSSTPLAASTTSVASTGPSQVPVGSSANSSKVASMVGAILGAVILVALLVALFFYRRQRSLKTHTHANSKPEKPKGHRRWGGLSSVDSAAVLEGIPIVPYTAPAYANSRGGSINKYTAEDPPVEKVKPRVHEEESPTDEVPTLSPRSYGRYSNGTLSATLAQQKSGLAAFNNEQARTASLKAVSPATSLVEDPFSEASPRALGIRSKSLSAAQSSPRHSNGPPTPNQKGLGSPRIGENGWAESLAPPGSMRRSTSANAVTRPIRKPVPQYDPSIEMTVTTLGAPSSYSQHSAQDSVTNFTSDSHTALGSSVDSTSPWLMDRVPAADRNIGLASQGGGPVHYLMPDMPPPPRA